MQDCGSPDCKRDTAADLGHPDHQLSTTALLPNYAGHTSQDTILNYHLVTWDILRALGDPLNGHAIAFDRVP